MPQVLYGAETAKTAPDHNDPVLPTGAHPSGLHVVSTQVAASPPACNPLLSQGFHALAEDVEERPEDQRKKDSKEDEADGALDAVIAEEEPFPVSVASPLYRLRSLGLLVPVHFEFPLPHNSCILRPPGTKARKRAFSKGRLEEQLLQKIRYMDIVAIALVILFAGIPTVVALAT
jgi:hypothetical protein